jgi:hypothetical protein
MYLIFLGMCNMDDTGLEKIQTPVRKNVAFVSGGVFNCLIRTTVRIPSPRLYSRRQTMSAVTFTTGFNSTAPKTIVNQGFQAYPSGQQSLARLTRRGRLARTIVVLSLSVVIVAGFAATSGANVAGFQFSGLFRAFLLSCGCGPWRNPVVCSRGLCNRGCARADQ